MSSPVRLWYKSSVKGQVKLLIVFWFFHFFFFSFKQRKILFSSYNVESNSKQSRQMVTFKISQKIYIRFFYITAQELLKSLISIFYPLKEIIGCYKWWKMLLWWERERDEKANLNHTHLSVKWFWGPQQNP